LLDRFGTLALGGWRIHEVKFFAGLEANGFAGGNGDFGSGSWIAADPGLSRLHCEDAEPAQLDPVAGDQRFLHGVEDCIYRIFGLRSGKACAFNDSLN
jgi:hypothetical protein